MTPDPVAALLHDLMSREVQRVLAAVHTVIRLPVYERLRLVPHLAAIRQSTDDLDLGGALYPNADHLRQAVRALEAARDGRCPCTLYPGYLFSDPNREQTAGAAEILASSPPDWFMTYLCRCRVCGRTYAVEQGESHFTWWDWQPRSGPMTPP